MNTARMLRELELLEVARLYGLEEDPGPMPGPSVAGLRTLVAECGSGTGKASWMFVGDAPGAGEDALGDPFAGPAGELLDGMLAAIGGRRKACEEDLDRQIELVAPRVIVALGKAAAARLLGGEASLASLRGQVHRYKDIPVVVTYHPAYLLRTLSEKAKAWEDLLFARRTLAAA